MVAKQISNPGNAFNAGGTWYAPIDSGTSQNVVNLVNATGLTLYQGDIVCLDVTGTQAVLSTSAGDPTLFGVVGGETNMPGAGGPIPGQLTPTRVDSVTTTATSSTIADTSITAGDLGKAVQCAGIPGGYAVITSVTAGTSFSIAPVVASASGTVQAYITPQTSAVGPGWSGLPFSVGAGEIVPVVTNGWGYININGLTTLTAKSLLTVSSGSVVAQAGTIGTNILLGVSLEAYAARNTTLTSLGITGHDTVRGFIYGS